MPISAVQEMKAWRVKTGDIPLSARIEKDFGVHQLYGLNSFMGEDTKAFAQGFQQLADMLGAAAERARLKTLGSMSPMFDYQSDIRTSLPGDTSLRKSRETAEAYYSGRGDRRGWKERQEETARINREAITTESFFRAMREKDYEFAEMLSDYYAPLKKVMLQQLPQIGYYGMRKNLAESLLSDMGLDWLVKAIQAEGMSKLGVQCVAFIADILNNYMGENIVTKGSLGFGKEMLSKVKSDKYKDMLKDVTSEMDTKYTNLQFGDLVELPGAYGHVMMFVGYNKSGEPVFIEAVGELQDSPYQRWKGYSKGAYKTWDEKDDTGKYYTAIGLKPHLQTYGKNYLSDRYAGKPTKVLRMTDMSKLPKDTEEALQLLQFIVPYGNESGGLK